MSAAQQRVTCYPHLTPRSISQPVLNWTVFNWDWNALYTKSRIYDFYFSCACHEFPISNVSISVILEWWDVVAHEPMSESIINERMSHSIPSQWPHTQTPSQMLAAWLTSKRHTVLLWGLWTLEKQGHTVHWSVDGTTQLGCAEGLHTHTHLKTHIISCERKWMPKSLITVCMLSFFKREHFKCKLPLLLMERDFRSIYLCVSRN